MKKTIKYLLLVILGLGAIDLATTQVVEKLMKNRYDTTIYSTYSTHPEIAIFGASRAVHHYIPSIISDSLHLTAYNYGIDGQNIYMHYLLLKMLIENTPQKPKIVLLELSAIDVNNTVNYNEEKLNLLYPYFSTEKPVRDLLSDVMDPKEFYIVNYSGLYRHNSNYISYVKWMIKGFPNTYSDGYIPLTNRWNKPIEFEQEQGNSLYPKKIAYIYNFIELCGQEGIQLFFAVSPNYKILPERQGWLEEVKRISEEKKIPLLYHESDSLFLAHKEWFNEPFHLNDEGAQIYSKIICSELKSLIKSIDADNSY